MKEPRDHILFFIDLLGSREAVRSSNPDQLRELTLMLIQIKQMEGNYDLKRLLTESGTEYRIRPAVSTFSDNIVISFQIDPLRGSSQYQASVFGAQRLISNFALDALNLGLLIRGGATVSSAYHHGGVVLGKALIEAYELESRVAQYPRIALSRKLYSQIQYPHIEKDEDGVTHLDYIRSMMAYAGESNEDRRDWFERTRQLADANIGKFEEAERWNEMSKWVWFLNKFQKAREQLAPLFE